MRLKVASRKSDLARWQAVQVARAFEHLSEKPHIEYIFKASLGDQDLDTPLANMGAKGVFTEDFYADLTESRCDMVVHSWKDLPVEARIETEISMVTLPRADVRDLLLVPETAWAEAVKTGKLVVLTSSPRRVYNLGACLKSLLPHPVEIEFVNIRGNVPTRLGKMNLQNAALVLAKAGIDRLLQAEAEGFLASEISVRALIKNCRYMVLPMSLNPAAAAQGALAVETLRVNETVKQMCAKLSDEKTFQCVNLEREILQNYGGGCHQKIGISVLAREYGKVLSLRGVTDQGQVLNQWKIENTTAWSKAASPDAIFPMQAKDNSWFERQYLPLNGELAAKPALFVARGEGLPKEYTPSAQQLIWTAGIQTWQRLAARGIWVNGSFDGLGENESPQLEFLAGALRWCKVSHLRGYTRPDMDLIPTYQLVPQKNHPDLRGKTHFFWMSTTSFERARQLFPEQINNCYNAAGPGSTFEHIRRLPDLKHPPKVFIGLEQFLAETRALDGDVIVKNEMNSEELFARSLRVAPGGVHSPVRAFKSVGGTPVFFARGEGPYLYSVEGERYIDFCQSFGPNILGHRDPDVEKVLRETIELGWCFGACEPYSLQLAEFVCENLPWVERIRFVCSGTEAVMSALRVARAATGRNAILKFDGCYHGHADSMLVKAGSGLAGRASSDSAGVPEFIAEQTYVCPLDDDIALEKIFKTQGEEIAAVIIEPMPANYGLLLQRPEFIKKVYDLAHANGSLVIFDEVISGFRVEFGGMAERLGMKPDLVTYGKVMGGGLAVGAYAGRADLMNLVAPAGRVYQAGTLSANPLAMRTGLATLQKLVTSKVHEVLEQRTGKFVLSLKEVLSPAGFDVLNMGSVFWIHPKSNQPLRNLTQLPSGMNETFGKLFHKLLTKGVYLAPSGYEVGFISFAHTQEVLDDALTRIKEAVSEII